MLQLFRRIFDKTDESPRSGERGDEGRKLEVATCVILLEAATADSQLSAGELEKIIGLLKTKFQMTDSEVEELIETSKKKRESVHDLWYFTNLINENLNNDERYELMEMIWRVIYSDGTLDKYEDYISHKLFTLLRIDHSKFIELKLKVKNSG